MSNCATTLMPFAERVMRMRGVGVVLSLSLVFADVEGLDSPAPKFAGGGEDTDAQT